MKKISMLIGLALVAIMPAKAARLDWSEALMARTCLAEVTQHVHSQAKPRQEVRFEARSTQVQVLNDDSFVCLVVGTWYERSSQAERRETQSYYAAVKPLPALKSRVGLVPAL